jgi:HAE1 family hydrophobic/amphiphilic exporter-1
MTSLAFILGVVPLILASGAGAASKVSVGVTVFGGMLAATVLTTLAVPAFYVLIQGLAERFGGPPETVATAATSSSSATAAALHGPAPGPHA